MRQLALLAVGVLIAADDPPKPQEPEPPKPGTVEPRPRAPADTSHDYVRFAFNFYNQSDHGGNPNVDESTMILEPMVLFSKGIGDRLTVTVKLQGDLVGDPFGLKGGEGGDDEEEGRVRSGANVRSGASGGAGGSSDTYFRVDGGAGYVVSDQVKVAAGVSTSTEKDYSSVGAYAKATYETPTKNDAFSIRLSGYFDSVELNFFDGTSGGSESRQTTSLGFAWIHVLTEKTVSVLNYDLTLQDGFLATAANSVMVAGTEVREILPDSRRRHSFFARVRHLVLPDLAVEPGAGFYFDDWGATAFNAEVNLFWEAIPDALIVRPGFRYHSQTQVDYFVPTSAGSIPAFRTQDSDLGTFDSQTISLKLVWPRAWGNPPSWKSAPTIPGGTTGWSGSASPLDFNGDSDESMAPAAAGGVCKRRAGVRPSSGL
jgi:hypothetical protein